MKKERWPMQLILEKRSDRSAFFAVASPILALLLTLFAGALIFASRGINPLAGLYVYFVEPLTQLCPMPEISHLRYGYHFF